MNKHVEKEYKMLVSKEQFDKLCGLYENLNFITQTNTYYDTVNGDIQKKKGAMRIRERNGRFLFTLKMRQENLDGLCSVSVKYLKTVFMLCNQRKLFSYCMSIKLKLQSFR